MDFTSKKAKTEADKLAVDCIKGTGKWSTSRKPRREGGMSPEKEAEATEVFVDGMVSIYRDILDQYAAKGYTA